MQEPHLGSKIEEVRVGILFLKSVRKGSLNGREFKDEYQTLNMRYTSYVWFNK